MTGKRLDLVGGVYLVRWRKLILTDPIGGTGRATPYTRWHVDGDEYNDDWEKVTMCGCVLHNDHEFIEGDLSKIWEVEYSHFEQEPLCKHCEPFIAMFAR